MTDTKTKADEFAFNGRRVRSWCVDAGIDYEDLAKGIRVPLGTLKSWLYGQRIISYPQAVAIADYFGKSLDDLIEHITTD